MRDGSAEQDTCKMKSFTAPTAAMLLVALILTMVPGMLILYFLGRNRWVLALIYFGIGILFYGITIAASVVGALCFGERAKALDVSAVLLCQTAIGLAFVYIAIRRYCSSQYGKKDIAVPEKIAAVSGEDDSAKESVFALANDGFKNLEEKKQTEIEVQPNESEEIEVIL